MKGREDRLRCPIPCESRRHRHDDPASRMAGLMCQPHLRPERHQCHRSTGRLAVGDQAGHNLKCTRCLRRVTVDHPPCATTRQAGGTGRFDSPTDWHAQPMEDTERALMTALVEPTFDPMQPSVKTRESGSLRLWCPAADQSPTDQRRVNHHLSGWRRPALRRRMA